MLWKSVLLLAMYAARYVCMYMNFQSCFALNFCFSNLVLVSSYTQSVLFIYIVQYALNFVITFCLLALQLIMVVHVLYILLWVVVMIFFLFTLTLTLTCWHLVQYYFELLWWFLLSACMFYCFKLPMLCSVYFEFLLQWLVVCLYLLLLCITYTMQCSNDLLHLGSQPHIEPRFQFRLHLLTLKTHATLSHAFRGDPFQFECILCCCLITCSFPLYKFFGHMKEFLICLFCAW